MQDGNAIEVKNITKKFKVYYDKGNSLKEKLLFWKRNAYEERLVLDGISFNVRKGEAIGLIGKNGCGKSTTLKMLTRIMYPNSGSIEIKGRVSSLIELGAGFHPDMSGRENIYTNAAIFGLNKKEIDERLEEIIEFSEMEEFLDNPVRTYSSGMYMRLAFAVAINVNADVLLIDEILGVGDVSFQKKCFEKLQEIKAKGTTIVIVSHSLEQIEKICERSIWIENGRIKEIGMPQLVHEHYKTEMEEERLIKKEAVLKKNETEELEIPEGCAREAIRTGNQKVKIQWISVNDEKKDILQKVEIRKGFKISLEYGTSMPGIKGKVACSIVNELGKLCCYADTTIDGYTEFTFDEEGVVSLFIESHYLPVGNYTIHLVLLNEKNDVLDSLQNAVKLWIVPDSNGYETLPMEHRWEIKTGV